MNPYIMPTVRFMQVQEYRALLSLVVYTPVMGGKIESAFSPHTFPVDYPFLSKQLFTSNHYVAVENWFLEMHRKDERAMMESMGTLVNKFTALYQEAMEAR